MELDWIWKAVLIIVGGTVLLRTAGRKSISQMTLTQTVIMIGLGSLLIQPVAGKSIWVTFGVGAVLVLTMILMEWGELKFDFVEKLLRGRSKVLIQNGALNERNLRKLRMTVDLLEAQLRQKNVAKLSDVQYATLEPNGQLGIILNPEAQAATKKDIETLGKELLELKKLFNERLPYVKLITQAGNIESRLGEENTEDIMHPSKDNPIFSEVAQGSDNEAPPQHLQ